MKCSDAVDQLDDYVDGSLSEAEFQNLELHLHDCAGCRKQERELHALLAEAAALPREMPPARDLWPGIAAGLGGRKMLPGRFPWRGSSLAWLAAAAALIAVTAAWLTGPRPSPYRIAAPLDGGRAVPAAAGTDVIDLAEAEYVRATAELLAAIGTRQDALSPETQAAVQKNLAVIDDALREVREALRKDPENVRLNHMLASTHQKKIDVLRRVMKLSAL